MNPRVPSNYEPGPADTIPADVTVVRAPVSAQPVEEAPRAQQPSASGTAFLLHEQFKG